MWPPAAAGKISASRLALTWSRRCAFTAGIRCGGSANYGSVPSGGEISDDMAEARAEFNRTLRNMGAHRSGILMSMLLDDQHPGVRWLATAQAALDTLALRCQLV